MDITGDFFRLTRSLTQAEIDHLIGLGVPPAALAHDGGEYGFVLASAKVMFEGEYFDFADRDDDTGKTAIIVLARDEDGEPADIVAARPADGRIGSWAGRVACLGQQNLGAARLGEPLVVHRDIMGWLRDGRRGLVVVHPQHARHLLAYAGPLQAEDLEHGLQIEQLVTIRPEIRIPSSAQAAA